MFLYIENVFGECNDEQVVSSRNGPDMAEQNFDR